MPSNLGEASVGGIEGMSLCCASDDPKNILCFGGTLLALVESANTANRDQTQLSEARFQFEKATMEGRLQSEKGMTQFKLVTEAYRAELDVYKYELAHRCTMIDKVGVQKALAFLGPPPSRPELPSFADIAASL